MNSDSLGHPGNNDNLIGCLQIETAYQEFCKSVLVNCKL